MKNIKNWMKVVFVLGVMAQLGYGSVACYPIFDYVRRGDLAAVKSFDGDVNIRTDRGLTPLDIACSLGLRDIVDVLINVKNACIDSNSLCLHYAFNIINVEIIKIVIEAFKCRNMINELKSLISSSDFMGYSVIDKLKRIIERYDLSAEQIAEYKALTEVEQREYDVMHPGKLAKYKEIYEILNACIS